MEPRDGARRDFAAEQVSCCLVGWGCESLQGYPGLPGPGRAAQQPSLSVSVCLPLKGTSSDRDMNLARGLLSNMSARQACHSMTASTRCTSVCLPWDPPA